MTQAFNRKDASVPALKGDKPVLPEQVANQLAEADLIQERIATSASMRPRPGPAKRTSYKKGANFTVNSEDQLSKLIDTTIKVVGPKKRGNKRIGRTAFYGDLVRYFMLLKQHGVTLPRGGNLSLAACAHGLGDILREHGYLNQDQTDPALANGKTRSELGHKLARTFDRVAEAVENTPA